MNFLAERLNRGMSAEAIATEIGIPPHVYRHTEKGGRPTPANALKIATFFGKTVTEIWPPEPQEGEEAAA